MNILEFANPAGFWWAVVALPIFLLYVLKVRLRRQPVSTFLFWDQVFHEKKPRSWWQQLRHLLSLLLQILLLALLIFALIDPLWQWQKAQRRKVLLVIDNSASMAAEDGGTTRLAKAKATAAALVRSLRVGDEMAILAAGGKPEVAIGLTDHARSLLEAVEKLEQTDAPSALSQTVVAARRLLIGDTRSSIYVLTDGCDVDTETLSQDPSISLIGYGSKQDNQAITQFQVRRSLLDAIGYQTLVEVTNFSDKAYKGRLELTLEDQLVDVIPVELEAGASKTMHLDHASATGGRLVAKLETSDALAIDNKAMAVLPIRRPIHVTLVTPGSVFLKSALESIPLVDTKLILQTLPKVEGDAEPASVPFVLPEDARRPIVILHRLVPSQLPPGKLLVINPQTNSDLWTVGKTIEQPIVASVSDQSPVMQHVKLTNVLFPEARTLTFSGQAETLIKTPLDEPLLSYIRRPTGDVLVLNVDLDQGDLPLRIAFPVMMKNALEWFDGSPAELQPAIPTGSSTKVSLPKAALQPAVATDGASSLPSSTEAGEVELVETKASSQASVTGTASSDTQFWLRDPKGRLTPLASDTDSATLSVMKLSGLWTIGTQEDLEEDPWDKRDSAESTTIESPKVTTTTPPTNSSTSTTTSSIPSPVSDMQRRERLRYLACNLSSRDESDLRPRRELPSVDQFGLLGLGGRSIWFYCVLMALALSAVEWWLYQRRIVG